MPQRLAAALKDRYRVEREIGEGGMATVYLAHDLRHDRRVALKVLRPELAAVIGAERFVAEIRTTANLQHSHILPLYDSGEADSFLFYVMPYVEGETLRDLLAREHQLSVEDAVRVTVAVASALDFAHRKGVVHRDIKPANILLQEGQPLVADFGIALAVQQAGGRRLTETGLSLGTPHYMSPEQASADRDADPRSDVYSLACVTYEMLTGEPPHLGNSTQAVLARILTEPARRVREVRSTVPAHLDAAVSRALEKLPADRFASAAEFALAVQGKLAATQSSPGGSRGARADGGLARPGLRAWWLALVPALTLGLGVLLGRGTGGAAEAAPVVRFGALPPVGGAVGTIVNTTPDLALSADGRRLVWTGMAGGRQRLYTRVLDQLDATALAGSEDAAVPFLSPGGDWIGFFRFGMIGKMPATGGPGVTVLENVRRGWGASWGPDDAIVFATDGPATGLLRAPASGAREPEVLTTPDSASGEFDHVLPEVLPNGRAVLFTVLSGVGGADARVEALDLASGERKVLVQGGTQPRYAASGHLVYATQGTLQAVAFDPERLEVTGTPVPVVDGVVVKSGGAANYALSAGGILVYQSGDAAGGQARLAWVDRQGREEALAAPPRGYRYPRLSPDGARIAVAIADQDQDIWIWELGRQFLTRFTFDPSSDVYPLWMPDGRRIAFASLRAGAYNLYLQAADGTGEVERLTENPNLQFPYAFTPDGRRLLIRQQSPSTESDLHVLDLEGERANETLVETPFNETNGDLSPDGRWLAYQSNESEQDEIYVRPFPDVNAGRWQVSTDGGSRPLWARDGRELFYLAGDGRLTSVPVETAGSTFAAGNPVQVLERAYLSPAPGRTYDVSSDGQRFLMIKELGREDGAATSQLVVVLNWFEELKRLVPVGGRGR